VRYLLDTHVLLWALATPERIPPAVRTTIADPQHEVLFSAASIWEIAIKAALGRPDFRISAARVATLAAETGFTELPVSVAHAAAVASLPPHHRDPFDRLLVAQASSLPARLLTTDGALPIYSDLVERIEV
jgi:PIN domain nuclease of toxin-antitoxin system